MEAEVSELVGAARGKRALEERPTQRNGYRRCRGRRERASSRSRSRSCARQTPPELPRAAQPLRAGARLAAQGAYVASVPTRKVDQVLESLGLRISK
jgi:putative transposase